MPWLRAWLSLSLFVVAVVAILVANDVAVVVVAVVAVVVDSGLSSLSSFHFISVSKFLQVIMIAPRARGRGQGGEAKGRG